ncbi:hypothetical protein ATCC90586_007675 [Pythium insidiosum]|nr:hypothetical protein ATCC90586_007675 [Pythium insidiosum]
MLAPRLPRSLAGHRSTHTPAMALGVHEPPPSRARSRASASPHASPRVSAPPQFPTGGSYVSLALRRLHAASPDVATYAPFRATFFHDPAVNPVLRGDGGEPDALALKRESKRLWSAAAPTLRSQSPKTATCPGSAFQNQGRSADRLYSSQRHTLGYDVHRSLRGTSLCSTTQRFPQSTPTPERVGPGSYDVGGGAPRPTKASRRPPLTSPSELQPRSDRLKQWGGAPDARAMDSADEWKSTSEKPAPTVFSFQRARQPTWITQIEERRRRDDPLARPPQRQVRAPSRQLPAFVQGSVVSPQRRAAPWPVP